MIPATKSTADWVLSGLLSVFLIIVSAPGKFVDWEGKAEMFARLGDSSAVIRIVGVVEVALAVLILIPRTGFLAALLLTAHLGGATATHGRVGDPFIVPIVIGVMVWASYGLRRPEVFWLALGRRASTAAPEGASTSVFGKLPAG